MTELGLKRKEASSAENGSWGRADPHAWPGHHPLHLVPWGAGAGHVQIIAIHMLCACGKRTVSQKFLDRERVPRAFEAFWEDQGSQLVRESGRCLWPPARVPLPPVRGALMVLVFGDYL